jgi:hypothetical protein
VNSDEPGELIPLTVKEIRRLHAHLHQPQHPAPHRIHWSRWRRRHQARSRRYQRRQRLTITKCGWSTNDKNNETLLHGNGAKVAV